MSLLHVHVAINHGSFGRGGAIGLSVHTHPPDFSCISLVPLEWQFPATPCRRTPYKWILLYMMMR